MFYQIMMYQLELIQLVEMTPIKYTIKKKNPKRGLFLEREMLHWIIRVVLYHLSSLKTNQWAARYEINFNIALKKWLGDGYYSKSASPNLAQMW